MVGWPCAAQDHLPAHAVDFGLAVLMFRKDQAKNAELLVLLCRSNTRLSG